MCMKHCQFLNVNDSDFQTFHAKHITCPVFTSTQRDSLSFSPTPNFFTLLFSGSCHFHSGFEGLLLNLDPHGRVFKLCIGYNKITFFAQTLHYSCYPTNQLLRASVLGCPYAPLFSPFLHLSISPKSHSDYASAYCPVSTFSFFKNCSIIDR